MTERAAFYRKLAYLGAIVVLAFPIGWLSVPSTTRSEGGKLAQLRKENHLSQVNLGEVDPASETIKLATLGLRGVAVNLLWEKANYYKKVEDWTNLTATLEQLAKLQPNFITFWKFQAWNLSYNVSVEFDDFRDRYYYVRRGIEFLQEGERYNIDHPQLLKDLGWFIGQKIGRADEHVQYRNLFKNDEDFHPPDRTLEQRDNWLVGKEWYLKAIDAIDNKGHAIGRMSQRDIYSSPAKSVMNYAEAIEEEGFFEKARRAWTTASKEWREFGDRTLEHSTGVKLQLGSQPQLEKDLAELKAKLDAMMPDARKKIADEKRAALTTDERQLLDTPADKLKPEQQQALYPIQQKIAVTDRDVAERIARDQPAVANQALKLATDIDRQSTLLQYTEAYKRDANYDYWLTRADFEQTDNALEARELMYKAKQAFREADLTTAKDLYKKGFDKWRLVIDDFPSVLDEEQMTGQDIVDFIKDYKKVLEQLDEQIGDDFPLWEAIEKFDVEQDFVEELKERKARQSPPAEGATQTPPASSETVAPPAQPTPPSEPAPKANAPVPAPARSQPTAEPAKQ